MLTSSFGTTGTVIRGIDPLLEGKVTDIARTVKIGDIKSLQSGFKIEGTMYPGLILGSELARHLAVTIGDTINVVSPTGEIGPLGMIPKFKRFAVTGIFDSGMYEYDSKLAYISIPDAQKFSIREMWLALLPSGLMTYSMPKKLHVILSQTSAPPSLPVTGWR